MHKTIPSCPGSCFLDSNVTKNLSGHNDTLLPVSLPSLKAAHIDKMAVYPPPSAIGVR